ncbi:MAG: cytochrome b/b6 domain-containing protein [bacterium]
MKLRKSHLGKEYFHPLIVRITHWTNFVALSIMVASGLRIFNASPLFDYKFPKWILLGGWLGGARLWHFAAMWIFFMNGVIAVAFNIISKHGRNTTIFRKQDISGVLPMIKYYLRIQKDHPKYEKYNSLQKLAYTSTPFLAIGVTLSGIVMYLPVQASPLTWLLGGYEFARWLHFLFMASLVMFFLGHLFMVIISGWQNFWSMITGWKRVSDN